MFRHVTRSLRVTPIHVLLIFFSFFFFKFLFVVGSIFSWTNQRVRLPAEKRQFSVVSPSRHRPVLHLLHFFEIETRPLNVMGPVGVAMTLAGGRVAIDNTSSSTDSILSISCSSSDSVPESRSRSDLAVKWLLLMLTAESSLSDCDRNLSVRRRTLNIVQFNSIQLNLTSSKKAVETGSGSR